jgi:hypothetical protein
MINHLITLMMRSQLMISSGRSKTIYSNSKSKTLLTIYLIVRAETST